MIRHRFAAAVGTALLAAFIGQATTYHFKSGATFEGEVVEVKGTNAVIRSDKDGMVYTLPIAYLTEADQTLITVTTGSPMSADDYFAGYRAAQQREKEPLPEQPENPADEGKIVGAFGLRLGQTFDTKYATATNKSSDLVSVKGELIHVDRTSYTFRPRLYLPHFTWYSADITPRSNLVYTVTAMASSLGREDPPFDDAKECDKLLSVLQQKYGRATNLRPYTNSVLYTIKQGTREVTLSHHTYSGASAGCLIISYTDTALYQQAKHEQLQLDEEDPARQAERKRLKQQL